GLLDLPLERLLAAGVEVPDELLGERRAALQRLARGDVLPRRARDADVVDAAVLVEPAVLDRHRCLGQPGRHLAERDRLSVLVGRNRAEQRAVACVDEGVLADLHRAQRVEAAGGGQRGCRAEAQREDQDDDRGEDDRGDRARAAAPADAARPLLLAKPMAEDEVEVVAARRHPAASVSRRPSASSSRRSLAAASIFWSRSTQRLTVTVAFSAKSVTYTSSPPARRASTVRRSSAVA